MAGKSVQLETFKVIKLPPVVCQIPQPKRMSDSIMVLFLIATLDTTKICRALRPMVLLFVNIVGLESDRGVHAQPEKYLLEPEITKHVQPLYNHVEVRRKEIERSPFLISKMIGNRFKLALHLSFHSYLLHLEIVV